MLCGAILPFFRCVGKPFTDICQQRRERKPQRRRLTPKAKSAGVERKAIPPCPRPKGCFGTSDRLDYTDSASSSTQLGSRLPNSRR